MPPTAAYVCAQRMEYAYGVVCPQSGHSRPTLRKSRILKIKMSLRQENVYNPMFLEENNHLSGRKIFIQKMSKVNYSTIYLRHELLRHYSVRKSTFKNWINNEFKYHSLVDAGFCYSGFGDEVFCFSCGIRVSGWKSTSHAFLMHRAQSPGCNFLNGYDLSIGESNVKGKLALISTPKRSSSEYTQYDQNIAHENVENYTFAWPPQVDIKSSIAGLSELSEIFGHYKLPLVIPKPDLLRKTLQIDKFFKFMQIEENRLDSFNIKKWPLENPKPINLAKAGFFYCQLNDNTQCAFCRIVLSGWDDSSAPDKAHQILAPYCRFVRNNFMPSEFVPALGMEIIFEGEIQPSTSSGFSSPDIEQHRQSFRLLEEVQQRLVCKICMEHEVSVRFNCRHVCACKGCSKKLKKCPVCVKYITQCLDVIIS